MDRRQFLRLTGGSAAAAALAAWFAPGCGRPEDPSGPPAPADPKRALLIALVPQDEREGWRRGQALGGILNHGGDAVLAALAGVELVCATPDRVPAEAQDAATEQAWFVLVTRDGDKVTAKTLTLDPPPEPSEGGAEGKTWEQTNAESRQVVEGIAATLHAFLAPAAAVPAAEVAARAADARERYVKKPPPGAHWGNNNGCGVVYEGIRNPALQWLCGMGMVPEVSRRFLDFYVKG